MISSLHQSNHDSIASRRTTNANPTTDGKSPSTSRESIGEIKLRPKEGTSETPKESSPLLEVVISMYSLTMKATSSDNVSEAERRSSDASSVVDEETSSTFY